MRKFASIMVIVGVVLLAASPAFATPKQDNDLLINGHKVYICHNVSHNPHVILVDVASVKDNGDLKGGHGVWSDLTDITAFVPHNSGGHDQDFLLLADSKTEAESKCPLEETTTTTTQPEVTTTTTVVTTTTTVPEITTTTIPQVTTTTVPVTEAPKLKTSEPVVTATPQVAPQVAPVPVTPSVPGTLPHTGSSSSLLAMLGAGIAGIGLVIRRFSRGRA
jgi:LPXTG-motif cell wall-anchored protein